VGKNRLKEVVRKKIHVQFSEAELIYLGYIFVNEIAIETHIIRG
jgi:transcriptional regulatory protein LevR